MPPEERRRPEWAPISPEWRRVFQQEGDVEVARTVGPDAGRFKRTGGRSWWYGCDIDGTLAAYGYRPRIHYDPPCWPLFFS
jgi:hypothetical protein